MTDLSGIDGVPNGRLTFRTVWGGPSPQAGFIEEVARIKQRLRTVEFPYQLDLFLTVGGEISPVPGPSGLRTPRVFLSRGTATGEIRISNGDVSTAADPVAFLRQTIHRAIAELMSRIAAHDPAFDADAEREKIAFPRRRGDRPRRTGGSGCGDACCRADGPVKAPGDAELSRRWTPERLAALQEQILEQARILKGPHRFDTDWPATDEGLLDLRGVKSGREGLQFRFVTLSRVDFRRARGRLMFFESELSDCLFDSVSLTGSPVSTAASCDAVSVAHP